MRRERTPDSNDREQDAKRRRIIVEGAGNQVLQVGSSGISFSSSGSNIAFGPGFPFSSFGPTGFKISPAKKHHNTGINNTMIISGNGQNISQVGTMINGQARVEVEIYNVRQEETYTRPTPSASQLAAAMDVLRKISEHHERFITSLDMQNFPSSLDKDMTERLFKLLKNTSVDLTLADSSNLIKVEAPETEGMKGKIILSASLVVPLIGKDDAWLAIFTQLMAVREIYRMDQGVYHLTVNGIKYDKLIEVVDYSADVVALSTTISFHLKNEETWKLIADRVLGMALEIMGTVDAYEYGQSMIKLPKHRFDQYLTWAMQRARAAEAKSFEEFCELLRATFTVQIEPLQYEVDGENQIEVNIEKSCWKPMELLIRWYSQEQQTVHQVSKNMIISKLIDGIAKFDWPKVAKNAAAILLEAQKK